MILSPYKCTCDVDSFECSLSSSLSYFTAQVCCLPFFQSINPCDLWFSLLIVPFGRMCVKFVQSIVRVLHITVMDMYTKLCLLAHLHCLLMFETMYWCAHAFVCVHLICVFTGHRKHHKYRKE